MPDRNDDRYTSPGLTVSVFTGGPATTIAATPPARPRPRTLPPVPRADPLGYVTEITEKLRTRTVE